MIFSTLNILLNHNYTHGWDRSADCSHINIVIMNLLFKSCTIPGVEKVNFVTIFVLKWSKKYFIFLFTSWHFCLLFLLFCPYWNFYFACCNPKMHCKLHTIEWQQVFDPFTICSYLPCLESSWAEFKYRYYLMLF